METLISYAIFKIWGAWALVIVCGIGAVIVWLVNKCNLGNHDE
jgi:hypothetical protein